MDFRIERDSMGEISVENSRYWGAQTQRSLEHFEIGDEKMPCEIIQAFAIIKKAAAQANRQLGVLDAQRERLICQVCDEILSGKLEGHFPLAVWQTGSGTQTNMNLNEVIANRGNQLAGELLLHPNDHVNLSQSSNDTFPTAMHIAAVLSLADDLLPAAQELILTLETLEGDYGEIVKLGRTHLQDAVPLTFGQELSGWRELLQQPLELLLKTLPSLCRLALGGTAVGTGLGAPAGFDVAVAKAVQNLTERPFATAQNKFHALTAKDALVFAHGGLKALAGNLMKMANDIRWLASGPRCGLGELSIPENEPGSSIMPGKVNPTQCEAIAMVAVQVMGNDTAVGFAASQGNFQLNVYMPVLIYNFLQSTRLLADGIRSFDRHCVQGILPNRQRMTDNLHRSLMLVTALSPHIGYDKAAQVAKAAHQQGGTLRETCAKLGFLSPEEFDRLVKPEEMV